MTIKKQSKSDSNSYEYPRERPRVSAVRDKSERNFKNAMKSGSIKNALLATDDVMLEDEDQYDYW